MWVLLILLHASDHFRNTKTTGQPTKTRLNLVKIALGSIGISAISAMLVVATLPPLLETPNKSLAMLIGFMVLAGLYFKFKKIVPATLTAAIVYGLIYTYLPL